MDFTEYEVGNNITNNPSFYWWVSDIFNNKDQITVELKSMY